MGSKNNPHMSHLSMRLLLTLLLSLLASSSANPLSRFLMMNGGDNNQNSQPGSMASASRSATGGSGDDQCIDRKAYNHQVASLQKETNEWKHKHTTLSTDCTKSQDVAKRLQEVNQDLVTKMAKLQSQSAKDLSQVKQELEEVKAKWQAQQKDNEALKDKLQDSLDIQEQIAAQRVQETERLWKHELEIAKTQAQVQVQNAQQDFEKKCGEIVQQNLAKVAATPASNDGDDQKQQQQQQLSQMLSVQRVKVKVLEEEKQKLTQQQQVLQGLVSKLEGKYEEKYTQREARLLKQFNETIDQRVQESSQAAMEDLKQGREMELNKAMEMCQEELEIKLQTQAAEFTQDLKEKLDNLDKKIIKAKDQKRAAIAKAQEEMEELKQQHLEATTALEKEKTALEETIKALKEEHSKELSHKEIKHTEEKAKAVNQTMEELRRDIVKAEEVTERTKSGLTQELTKVKQQLSKVTVQADTSTAKVKHLTKDLKHAKEQVKYWEDQFGRRSYFNVTYVWEDSCYMARNAQHSVSHQVGTWWENWKAFWVRLFEPMMERVEPWYNHNLKKHVDPIRDSLSKQYQEHVSPLLQQMGEARSQAVSSFRELIHGSFETVVEDIKRNCPKWKKQLSKSKYAPEFSKAQLDSVCQRPAQALAQSLGIALLVVVILFHSAIWNFLCTVVLLCFRGTRWLIVKTAKLLWYLCPLRWLLLLVLPSKSKTKSSTSNGSGKKKIGSQAAQ